MPFNLCDSGRWVNMAPTCPACSSSINSSTDCCLLAELEHGHTIYDGLHPGERIAYRCDDGYTLVGNVTLLCLPDRKWNVRQPRCVPQCPPIPALDNGHVEGGFAVGSRAVFTCHPGYKLLGDGILLCKVDRTWSADFPLCLLVSCMRPQPPENGSVRVEGTIAGGRSHYSCDDGFVLRGDKLTTCHDTGEWDSVVPSCIRAVCRPMQLLQNGHVNVTDNTRVGSRAAVVCNRGFRLHGKRWVTCQETLQWSVHTSQCLPMTCTVPQVPQHGRESHTGVGVGDTIFFACDKGFMRQGAATASCHDDGTWSSRPPRCVEVFCVKPSLVRHASIQGGGRERYQVGNYVQYVCEPGFQLVGRSRLICYADGTWSYDTPTCMAVHCAELPAVADGSYYTDSDEYESVASLVCNPGYKVIDDDTIQCNEDGTWTNPSGHCSEVNCYAPPSVSNGFLINTLTNFMYGSMAEYRCYLGYNVGPSTGLKCSENGTWIGELPVCREISCPAPTSIENGEYSHDGLLYTDSITYECHAGYRLSGAPVHTCLLTGEWDAVAPVCIKHNCSTLRPPIHGLVDVNGNAVGSVANFSCEPGYRISGVSMLTCQKDESWDNVTPECVAIECAMLYPPNHGYLHIENNVVGSLANYSCERGYLLKGEAQLQCDSVGMWSSDLPVCEEITCVTPQQIQGGNVVALKPRYRVNDTVTYACVSGYRMRGSRQRICTANGRWSGSFLPHCELIVCPILEAIENGIWVYDNNTVDSHAQLVCDEGYRTDDAEPLTCSDGGSWTGTIGLCRVVTCDNPPIISNSLMLTAKAPFTFNATVTYECMLGYTPSRESLQITCSANGTWEADEEPQCLPISCAYPDAISRGYITVDGSGTYGDSVTYSCEAGYRLVGDATRVCNMSGEWSALEPRCEKVVCISEEIEHGAAMSHDHDVVPAMLTWYECDIGYRLVGARVRLCGDDGTFNTTQPICDRVYCPDPAVADLLLSYLPPHTSPVYGSVVSYTCPTGYALNGSSTRECSGDGDWSSEEPSCERVTCPDPPVIENGWPVLPATPQAAGSVISYECSHGFDLLGSRTLECSEDGTWGDKLPVCGRARCQADVLPKIENGFIQVSGSEFGSTATIACNYGYKVTGNLKLRCLANSTWQELEQGGHCGLVTCPKPRAIQNGIVSAATALQPGTTISYSCMAGYRLSGQRNRTCTGNGTWNGEEPSCERITCIPPGRTPNGITEGDSFLFGDEVSYTCIYGFHLLINRITDSKRLSVYRRICNHDGSWSNAVPECVQTLCPDLPAVSNGEHSRFARNIVNTTVTYSCNLGYTLEGRGKLVCRENGVWDANPPSCERVTCGKPAHVPYAIVTGDKFAFGDSLTYECTHGYRTDGSFRIQCLPSGKWTTPTPRCVAVTCQLPNVDDGTLIYATEPISIGDGVMLTCEPGYVAGNETASATCGADGTLSSLLTCIPAVCPAIPVVDGAVRTGASSKVGAIVTYRCSDGFVQDGPTDVICQPNMTWSDAPRCLRIQCDEPPSVQHGNFRPQSSMHFFDDLVIYSCGDGYELYGDNVLICSATGRWEGWPPVCQPVLCGRPPIIEYASTVVQQLTYGSQAEYVCNTGYILKGPTKVFCMADGTWTPQGSTCTVVSCGSPPLLLNGNVKHNATTFGSIVTYSCQRGYGLTGESSMQCGQDGQWSGSLPDCVPVDCGEPIAPRFGKLWIESSVYLSRAVYSCDEGYRLLGRTTRHCLHTGRWSGETPRCSRMFCIPPDKFLHGYVINLGTYYGDEIKFVCEDGFQLLGNASAVCQRDGRWSGEQPACQLGAESLCLAPPTPPRALGGNRSAFREGETVTFACQPGYTPLQDLSVTCLPDGNWTRPHGLCTRETCGRPPVNHGAVIVGTSYYVGDYVTATCPPGKMPSGGTVLRCTEARLWSGTAICQAYCKGGCHNGGVCTSYNRCVCESGWTGPTCRQPVCVLPCLHGGHCVSPYSCRCTSSYSGPRCETPVCEQPCLNGGACIAPNTCICPIGFLPPTCLPRATPMSLTKDLMKKQNPMSMIMK
ncbi:PREDICTED: sushi, von Willebrand factor type A, EGF and pentraxin domain-containing protein 1-like isoform X2 [Priapulus caudatus]|uniref:Sushi, von Willebrand factor type A, EGF and pentraxin domain-containing protein 1-like isoform X2 n=1 Tax=Priapulus caudatus TaxID=37621 RepID=A0ABM1EAM7_PRICU|nr:PREDICTED: sushi, von Willebrand factor type A, EGF and pentraxin domain-containing protein 1-like isoform X2 [Priapulus caudatus]